MHCQAVALLAAILLFATPTCGEVTNTRSLLCLHSKACEVGCGKCKCGKCLYCGSGYSRSSWHGKCKRDCKSCDHDYCAKCDCDGSCKHCKSGYDWWKGKCKKIWYEEPVHYKPKPSKKPEPVYYKPKPSKKPEPVYYKPKPSKKPEPVYYEPKPSKKPEPVHYGGGRAHADAKAKGYSSETYTNTNCDGWGCSSTSKSYSESG